MCISGMERGWDPRRPKSLWVLSSVPYLSQKIKNQQPSAWCSQRNNISFCPFLTTLHVSTEKWGNLHGESSSPTTGSQRGGDLPLGASLGARQCGHFYCVETKTNRKLESVQEDFPHHRVLQSVHTRVLFFEFIISGKYLVWKAKSAGLKMCILIAWSCWEYPAKAEGFRTIFALYKFCVNKVLLLF